MRQTYALIAVAVMLVTACGAPGGGPVPNEITSWVQNVEIRPYPNAFGRDSVERKIELTGLAGEFLSAQVLVKPTQKITALSGKVDGLSGLNAEIRVRYGAWLPVDETMMLTPDPLLEVSSIEVPANMARSVWITLAVPREAAAGTYSGTLALIADGSPAGEFPISVEVLPAALPAPNEWEYYINIWQDPSGIARAHKVEHWSEEHWALLKKYADNFVAHGMDVITTSIVFDPWGSQTGYPYETMVEWNYPGEYQSGQAGKFTWDFTVFDRYVQLMLDAGMSGKIDCFSMVEGPWINTNADIRYYDTEAGEYRELDLTLGDDGWKEAWRVFLPVFAAHLKEKGWFEKAYLAFDEKPEKEMKMIYGFLVDAAPGFNVSIAGGYPGDENKRSDEVILHYQEIATEHEAAKNKALIEDMRSSGRLISFYTACTPQYPNVFLYSQLRECRLLPWIALKHNLSGYLRWAVSAFPEDVWSQPNYKWHSGDMYFVYPGPDGPLDGMRWELFRQGVQDCEAQRMALKLARAAGRDDLVGKLEWSVDMAITLESCDQIPYVGEARAIVNDAIRELAASK